MLTLTITSSYRGTRNGLAHAVIENTEEPCTYRTLCDTHLKVYAAGCSPINNLLCDITCKKCLRIMKNHGLKVGSSTGEQKFFLITYDDGSRSVCFSLDELHEDMKRFEDEITDILLIESYRTVSTKQIITIIDEDGKEITKEDML